MDIKIVLRQILTDRLSLRAYQNGIPCSWEDIKRRMLLNEKEQCPHVPDHLYRSANKLHISENKIDSLVSLINEGFLVLSNYFLDWNVTQKQVFVRKELFPEWQNTLTFISPLIPVAVKIANKKPFNVSNPQALTKERIENYINDYIKPNVLYTSIPSPKIEKLEELTQRTGFNDLHIHLNGTTEIDVLWQNCINDPSEYFKYLKQAEGNFLVVEQIEYEDTYKDTDELLHLLNTARALRYTIINDYLFNSPHQKPIGWDNMDIYKINDLISKNVHPMGEYLKSLIDKSNYTDITLECFMHVLILSRLAIDSYKYKYHLSKIYHHYLLIEGVINKFVVQQLHQKGFQQFQKLSENKFRDLSEKKYLNRFLQLNGNKNKKNLINHIEGRFSPGKSTKELSNKIGIINEGLIEFMKFMDIPIEEKNKLFSLTCHFIKSWDKTKDSESNKKRHEALRRELWQKAKAIIDYNNMPEMNLQYKIPIIGIDAASSEFNTPPEVFAPVYRLLRQNSTKLHFTFHAGEDFSHIISGLRAIYESICFLELAPGDRIGHATALGISSEQWMNKMDKYIYLSQGEWLDNLVFLYHLTPKRKIKIRKYINGQIVDLSEKIYGKPYSVRDLIKSWLLRKYCPILFFSENLMEAQSSMVFDLMEWNSIIQEKTNINSEVMTLMKLYHFRRENYNKIKYFQQLTAKYMIKKDIVIETLPTSNTRISIYGSTREHHILRWLSNEKRGFHLFKKEKFPKIVLGTDDPGIFSTNIYNEYAHVYTILDNSGQFNTDATIEDIYRNSFKYSFGIQEDTI